MRRARYPIGLVVLAATLLGLGSMGHAQIFLGRGGRGRGPGGPGAAPTAPATPAGPPAIFDPEWLSQPTAADIARAYPARAHSLGQPGLATLRCTVKLDGGLALCSVAREYPTGFEFGAGALKLVQKFRMKPVDRKGAPVAERPVSVLVQFQTSP